MTIWFVTSTGTDIGKTLVGAALVHQLHAAGEDVDALKPVVTGYPGDALETTDCGVLLRALGRPVDDAAIAAITPWRYTQPLSPDMAAARDGAAIDFDAVLRFSREGAPAIRLVEGAGGVAVPLDDTHTMLDWMVALDARAILVAGTYLGTISHTLTALGALRERGIPVASIVLSASESEPVPAEETAAAIRRHGAGELPILTVPRLPDGPDPWRHAPDLRAALGPR